MTILVGTARPGDGDPALTGSRMRVDNISLNTISGAIWDNDTLDNLWGTANNWDPDQIPTVTTPVTIDDGSGIPLVEADHEVASVWLTAGQLTIGADNTLTVTGGFDADGTLALENNSRLSAASGSIAAATIDGRASIAVPIDGNLEVLSLSPAAGELVKEDAGTLTLHGDSIEVAN
ncbi:MAG: hypothetical protein GY720_24195, partial [bacterium]|nr:hypothetical protein [bacterium]